MIPGDNTDTLLSGQAFISEQLMKMPSSKCKGICQRCGAKSIKFLGPIGKFSSDLETAPDTTGNSQPSKLTNSARENPETQIQASLWIFFMFFAQDKLHVDHVGRFLPMFATLTFTHQSAPPQGVQNQIDLIDHANTFGKDLQDLSQFGGFLLQRRSVALGPTGCQFHKLQDQDPKYDQTLWRSHGTSVYQSLSILVLINRLLATLSLTLPAVIANVQVFHKAQNETLHIGRLCQQNVT